MNHRYTCMYVCMGDMGLAGQRPSACGSSIVVVGMSYIQSASKPGFVSLLTQGWLHLAMTLVDLTLDLTLSG
jgi:hypothetical protein